jgi:hypothetical protein
MAGSSPLFVDIDHIDTAIIRANGIEPEEEILTLP